MHSHKTAKSTPRWQDASLYPRPQDEPLFEKLKNADENTSVDIIDGEAHNDSLPWFRPGRQRRRGYCSPSAAQTITALTIICLLLLTSTLILWQSEPSLTPTKAGAPSHTSHCGNSTSEARALGCEFDLLSYSWTPPACTERGTATEFRTWLYRSERHFGAFPFFYDPAGLQHVEDEVALSESYGRTIHTTQEEHLGHCTYLMRRWHRLAMQEDGWHRFNSRYGRFVHTQHCSDHILSMLGKADMLGAERLDSTFRVTFESC